MKYDPNIVEINVCGVKKKINLKEAFISKNVTPLELNKKLSILPSMYSFYGSLRVKLDVLIDEKKEEFERWLAKAIKEMDKKEYTSEKQRERAVRNSKVLGKRYDKYKKEIRDLKYYHSLADVMRKGYNTQFFCIKEQVNMIMNEKSEVSFKKKTEKLFNKTRRK